MNEDKTMTRQLYNALISDFLLQITNTSGNNMSIDTENGSGLLTLPSYICNKNNKRCQKKNNLERLDIFLRITYFYIIFLASVFVKER